MAEQPKHELELLKAAANEPYEKGKTKWNKLLKALHLSATYVAAIQEILRQGMWQKQRSPTMYVRKAAVRWAVSHGLVEIRRKAGKRVVESGLNPKGHEVEMVSRDRELRLALLQVDDAAGAEAVVDNLPAQVMDERHEEVNWEKVAEMADLDSGERLVLDLRLMGLNWRDAIAACLTADDRTILHTAWRRFERHKDVLKQVLLTGKPQRVKRKTRGPELELMFSEDEEGRLKILFKKIASR